MTTVHHLALLGAYGTAILGWIAARRISPALWPSSAPITPERPWPELGGALVAVALTPLIGQVYVAGRLLPENGVLAPVAASVNQAIIFLPVLLHPVLRRTGRDALWIGGRRAATRIAAGCGLAALALLAWSLLRAGDHGFLVSLGRLPRLEHLDALVQVGLEDVTIALLFVHLTAALGARTALVVAASLFAAGHVPALIAEGAPATELLWLVADAGLVVLVLSALRAGRDVLWFWPVHTVLDLTQFASVTGVSPGT